MRTIGVMLADLATGQLGLPSRLEHGLAGVPVLRRSVLRALGTKKLRQVVLLTPPEQQERANALIRGLGDRLAVQPLPQSRDLVFGRFDSARIRLSRQWALSCWRGGIGGACWFDEITAPAAMLDAAKSAAGGPADAVVPLSPEAALADPATIDATVELFEKNAERYRLAFAAAPPGLAVICLAPELLADMARTGQTVGRLLGYDPADPRADYAASEAALRTPVEVMACSHRLLADTARGLALLESLIRQLGDGPGLEKTAGAAETMFADRPEPWPREIDLELTTERGVADVLRPGAPLVPRRGPITDADVRRVCDAIREMGVDDLAVTLGGFGDALLHPRALEIAADLKKAGALAVAARTSGLTLDEAMISRLRGSAVDVLAVELDAATPEGYRRLKGADEFARVTAAMQSLLTGRPKQANGGFGPLLVAEMIKCQATLDEMEPFFDRWRLNDEANIASMSDYGGQFRSEAGPGWPTAPPRRRPCLRLNRRLAVLADGSISACDEGLAGQFTISGLAEQPIKDAWRCQTMEQLREAHREGRLDGYALCRGCHQWHRA